MYDAIIAGGGPAGLSAALVLGRCRRRVLLCDNGHQRNLCSQGMHGYLTRDGMPPAEFLRLAFDEIAAYGVEVRRCTVKEARKVEEHFEVTLEDGSCCRGRKLLISTGVKDDLPPLPNIEDFYGKSVHHCPYCDGWENRDKRIAVYAKKPGLAISLKASWSDDVILFTDGPQRFTPAEQEKLARHKIPVRKEKVSGLEGSDGEMRAVILANGESVPREAMFFSTGQKQSCELAAGLGCVLNNRGTIDTNKLEMTNVPGLFVAGDVSRDMQMVIVAAAEGAKAAFAINLALQDES